MDFSSWPNENRATKLHRSCREVEASLSTLSSPLLLFLSMVSLSLAENLLFSAQKKKKDFNLIHNLNALPKLCHVFTIGSGPFLP